MSSSISNTFGFEDTSYIAAGKDSGLRKLTTDFYAYMDRLDEAKKIRDMHKDDLSIMIDKLTLFLSMWLGGPKTYREKYSRGGMPMLHRHLVINEEERDAWLLCMDKAIYDQSYTDEFKDYLMRQLRFPAEMIRKTSLFN